MTEHNIRGAKYASLIQREKEVSFFDKRYVWEVRNLNEERHKVVRRYFYMTIFRPHGRTFTRRGAERAVAKALKELRGPVFEQVRYKEYANDLSPMW